MYKEPSKYAKSSLPLAPCDLARSYVDDRRRLDLVPVVTQANPPAPLTDPSIPKIVPKPNAPKAKITILSPNPTPQERPPNTFPSPIFLPARVAPIAAGGSLPSRASSRAKTSLETHFASILAILKKGTGDIQSPDCLLPENCLELSTSDGKTVGYCIYIPGQLYGSGSYKAVIRHPQGAQCLIRYGGCDTGLICVDVRGSGSVGTCEPGHPR